MNKDAKKLKELKNALESDKSLQNYRKLADFYVETGDYEKAFKIFGEILKINPVDVLSLLNSGSISFMRKDFISAKDYFLRAISIEPDNSLLHYNIANTYAELMLTDEALLHYKTAIQLGMRNASVYLAMGILYSDLGKYPDSKECFLKALKFEPENPDCWSNYSTLLIRMENTKEAETALKKALALKPDSAQNSLALANFYVQTGNIKKAYKYFDKSLEIMPDYYSAWVCKAICASDENDFELAIKCYKNAIEIEPDKPNAYILLAHLLLNEKRYSEAIDTYKRSLKFSQNKTMVYVFIANAYMLDSDMKSAIDCYRLAIKESPDNQEVMLIYIDILNDFIEGKLLNAA